jgi:DNA-binding MarR family transcriptional regulator
MRVPIENLGYWLFYAQRCAEHAFGTVLEAWCKEHGKSYVITPAQWGALQLLFEHDGLTIGRIAQVRGVDAPTITGIIKRLELSGLVERRHNREDRRNVKVYLTPEGTSIKESLPQAVGVYYNVLMRGFSEEDQQDFLHKLQQIVANLSTIAPDTGDRFHRLPDRFHHRRQEDETEQSCRLQGPAPGP